MSWITILSKCKAAMFLRVLLYRDFVCFFFRFSEDCNLGEIIHTIVHLYEMVFYCRKLIVDVPVFTIELNKLYLAQ